MRRCFSVRRRAPVQAAIPVCARDPFTRPDGLNVASIAERLYREHGPERVAMLGPHLGVWAIKR